MEKFWIIIYKFLVGDIIIGISLGILAQVTGPGPQTQEAIFVSFFQTNGCRPFWSRDTIRK